MSNCFSVWLTWCVNVPEILSAVSSSILTTFLPRLFPTVLLLFLCLGVKYASWKT